HSFYLHGFFCGIWATRRPPRTLYSSAMARNQRGLVSRKSGIILLCCLTVLVVAAIILAPRVPQPLSYYNFADQRAWLGIPNFGDVNSNAPFAFIGIWGLIFLFSHQSERSFADKRERIS